MQKSDLMPPAMKEKAIEQILAGVTPGMAFDIRFSQNSVVGDFTNLQQLYFNQAIGLPDADDAESIHKPREVSRLVRGSRWRILIKDGWAEANADRIRQLGESIDHIEAV